jgi:uncharacterized membrane protein YhaH (DUF805 family)
MDLNKNQSSFSYFCLIEDKQHGPMDRTKLLSMVNSDTLIWREGIDWTVAAHVPELSDHFISSAKSYISTPPKIDLNKESKPFEHKIEATIYEPPVKMFSAPFSFEGRIRRTEYGLSFIIYIFIYVIIKSIINDPSFGLFALAYIPLVWFFWAQGAKRCHDRGNSGWYQIIPFYVLWLIFAEGDSTENEYGRSPK